MKKLNKFTHKILPFILIGVIASTTVSLNYNKIREVKAVAVVDDALVVAAILAMCGVAWTSIDHFWSPGGWINEGDSPVADPDLQKWADGFNERWQKQWDDDVKKKALELGLIDENGNIKNNGGSSGGGDDNDNKFPSWSELKNKIVENGGKITTVLSPFMPFLAMYSYDALKQSGANLADKFIDDGTNIDMSYVTANTRAYIFGEGLSRPNDTSAIIDSSYPICFVKNSLCAISGNDTTNKVVFFSNTGFSREESGFAGFYGYARSIGSKYNNYDFYKYDIDRLDSKFSQYPTFSNTTDAYNYLKSFVGGSSDDSSDYINPITIGITSDLKDTLKNSDDMPDSPFSDFSRLPTDDEFKKYLEDLKNTSDDDDKQKVIDDFIKTITTPSETPTPDPKPDPTNPTPTPNLDTPDNPDSDNDFSVRDLRLVFPFCIPFDLVDCFRLFNSEPETPRVQFPVHFGIVDKDYTFDIDLKDFNNVALVCRSMFLILYIVGLVLATRSLIRG